MAIETKFIENSMLKSIESVQKGLKSKNYDSASEEEKRKNYAAILAVRAVAKAERGKKKTLKVPGKLADYEAQREALAASPSFQAFIQKQGHETMRRELTTGHGGLCEENFQKYVLEQKVLPSDVPDRWMPTAKERIEQQQKKLKDLDASSDEAIAVYAEIFRARRSVNAQRGKGGSLEVKINGQELAKQEDLAQNEVFRQFVEEEPGAVRRAFEAGHSGAAEDLFKEYILNLDRIPAAAPQTYLPSAYDRTAAIIKNIKEKGDDGKQYTRFTELMATRDAVGAVRGQGDSLKKQISKQALMDAFDKWVNCETFQKYVKEHEPEARRTLEGRTHGGALSDAFKEHVRTLDHIPADVPADHMPTAYDHLEALKAKLTDPAYYDSSDERKLTLAAEIMAAREAVDAVRGKADSLKKPLDPQKLNEAYKKWTECKAFKDYVLSQDPAVRAEAHTAAGSGHGGALGDKFREYVTGLDKLDADIPPAFMPTARTRIEALQKKIRETPDLAGERKLNLYAELLATRSSVNAVRGKGKSLEVTLEPTSLDRDRQKLLASTSFQNFINDEAQQAAIREATSKGHAGALEDLFKEYILKQDRIDENVPSQYMPTAAKRIEALQEKIKAPAFLNAENKAEVYAELMATRQAVNAVRGKKESLAPILDGEALRAAREAWDKCKTFADFVNSEENQREVREAALKGHSGALMDKFQEKVRSDLTLAEDLPESVIPTAEQRIEGIQKELKENELLLDDEIDTYCAQILAVRDNVGAKRKTPETLRVKPKPDEVNAVATILLNCQAFQDYMANHRQEAVSAARSGHGGELADKFKEYVRKLDVLPEDLPSQYAPTALERIESLQKRIKAEYDGKTPEEKTKLLAEVLGARRSVHAVRGEKDSLKFNLNPKTAGEEAAKLADCEAFKEFVRNHPNEAKSAVTSGHGGKLEDQFKEYVLNMDRIPEDVPAEYMPTAAERTKVLQKKIDAKGFSNKTLAERTSIYRELMATRQAVNSVRGDVKSLSSKVDAAKLDACRKQLFQCSAVDDMLTQTDGPSLIKAATSGHGGALDDKFREYVTTKTAQEGVVPDKVPKRFKPSASQMLERLQADLKKDQGRYAMPQYDAMKPEYMKKIACAMYCKKLQHDAYQNGGSPELDPEKMNRTVNKLMNSAAYQAMFQQPNSTYRMADCVANQRMSDLFNYLTSHNGQLEMEQPQPQPVVQNQPVQNQPVQNQLNQNQNQQLNNNGGQPPVNQNVVNQNQQLNNQQQLNQINQQLNNQQLNNQLLQNLNQQGLYFNRQGQLVNQQGQRVNVEGQVLDQQQPNNDLRPVRQRGGSMRQPAPRQLDEYRQEQPQLQAQVQIVP